MEMTPISFALEILLDCETLAEAHKKCRKYIKALEGAGQSSLQSTGRGVSSISPSPIAQAPSTQRLMEQHGPIIAMPTPAIKIPTAEIDRETGRPMVATGNGMKGPRKY